MTFAEIKNIIRETAEQCGADKAILFGSYARGTATAHSDIDLIIIEATNTKFIHRADKYMDALWDKLHHPVDVLVYTPSELEEMSWKPFIKQALREGETLYERRKAA